MQALAADPGRAGAQVTYIGPKIAAEGHKALREAGIGVIEHMCRWSRAYPLTSRGSAGYLA